MSKATSEINQANVDRIAELFKNDVVFVDGKAEITRAQYEATLPEDIPADVVERVMSHNLEVNLGAKKAIGLRSVDLFRETEGLNETEAKVWMGHDRYYVEINTSRSKEVSGGIGANNVPNPRKTIVGYSRSKLHVNAGKVMGEISDAISDYATNQLT